MNLRFWRPKREIYGATIIEGGTTGPISQVSDSSLYSQYVKPEVDFSVCYEYYRTVGKVQNAVESYIAEILSRDWYFDGGADAVRKLEHWESTVNLSRLLEYMVRDWLVCGNSIMGISDWEPVQITSIVGVKRNRYGVTERFVQHINGSEVMLDPKGFVHTKFIELNREAWGIGMFHSLLTSFDYNNRRRSLPQLEIYRRKVQLLYRILERYGSPVTVWFFENVARAEFDKQVEELRALEAGDRRILSKKVEIATETIDSRGNLLNATVPDLNADVESGLQTSANRVITQPSAMADARVAGEKDDTKVLYVAEKLRAVMNAVIIPNIINSTDLAEFKWGKQDSFEFDFGQLLQARSAGLISPEEARQILQSVGWKLDDDLYAKDLPSIRNRQDRLNSRGDPEGLS
ncbi:MAG: phage portal protein family protein [Nitrososphaera sp.]